MSREAIKQALAGIVKANTAVKANPSVVLLHLVKAIYADKKLTTTELVKLCGLNQKTYYRNADDFRAVGELLPTVSTSDTPPCPPHGGCPTVGFIPTVSYPRCPTHGGESAKEKSPYNPLIKKNNISSLRSDISGACVCTHEGTADAEELEGFSSFCRIYPKAPKGAVLIKAQQLWGELLEAGYTAKDIESAVWVSVRSEDWTKENGRYIPRADNFLDRILHPEKETSSGPIKAAPSASEGSGYIQVPLDDHGAFGNVAESSVEARFLKAYGRYYKNQYAFNVAWANAKRDVDPELLVYCAEVARDKARERDGDTQYIRLPEEWLRDGRYMDYIKDAKYKQRTSGPSTIDIDAMLGLK